MTKNRGTKTSKFLGKNILLFYVFLAFCFAFSLVKIFSFNPVFAMSESPNYKFIGGQLNPLSGGSSSATFGLEIGGQPIAGRISGLAYDSRLGSTFSGRTETVTPTTTPPGGGGGGGGEETGEDPFVTQLNILDITSSHARVVFDTNEPTIARILYGQGDLYDLITDPEASFAISHESLLLNLIPNTQYKLVVQMQSVPGRTAESFIYTFTTLPVLKIVPNVSNLVVNAYEMQVDLSWVNPVMLDFGGVKLIRNLLYYPANPSDGEVLFDGSSQSYSDLNVVFDQRYYYTLFVYDTSFNYSSGAIVSAIIVAGEIPPIEPPPIEPPPVEPPPIEPPPVEPPGGVIPSEPPELPPWVVPVDEEVETIVSVFSSIKQNIFEGDIVMILEPNVPFSEKAIDTARILVRMTDNLEVENFARRIIAPAALTISFFVLIPSLASIILPLLKFLFLQPLLFFGFRKRKKYGLLYNSLNKLPIDLGVVRLIDTSTDKIVRSIVTDAKGRYGFFVVKPGIYKIEVIKDGFVFPTKLLLKLKEDGRMLDIYHGEDIIVDNQNVNITVNIPMDPIGAEKTPARAIFQRKIRFLQYVLSMSGIFSTAIVLLFVNTWYIWIFLAMHIAMFFLFLRFVNPKKPKGWGVVYDADNRKPINRVVARLFSKEYNKLIDFRVTDRKGRYAFLVGPSNYYVAFEKEGYEGYQTPDLNFKNSKETETFISRNIRLEKTSSKNKDLEDGSTKSTEQETTTHSYWETLQVYQKTLETYKEIIKKLSNKPTTVVPPPPPPEFTRPLSVLPTSLGKLHPEGEDGPPEPEDKPPDKPPPDSPNW